MSKIENQNNISQEFLEIMKSKHILKVGVGIRDDLEKLLMDFNIKYDTFLDLRSISRKKAQSSSLEFLCKHYFGQNSKIQKSKSVQMSNWELYRLSDPQIRYAAYDALAAVEIYNKMKHEGYIDFNNVHDEKWLYTDLLNEIYNPEMNTTTATTTAATTINNKPTNRTSSNTLNNTITSTTAISTTTYDDNKNINNNNAMPTTNDTTSATTNTNTLITTTNTTDPNLNLADERYYPLCRKEIKRLINHANESTFKIESLYKNFYEIDIKWFHGVTHPNFKINDDAFWRQSLKRYLSRFYEFKVSYYTIPQIKALIKHYRNNEREYNITKDFFTINDYKQNFTVLNKYIENIENQTKLDNIKNKGSISSSNNNCSSSNNNSSNSSKNDVTVIVAVNEISISISQATTKTKAAESDCKRLLKDLIDYQQTIPIEMYLKSITNNDNSSVPIASYLKNLNESFLNYILKHDS